MTDSDTTSVPLLHLNDGNRIPQLGLGVFKVPPDDAADVVRTALQAGYRHIDTAAAYGNETGVAEGIERSGVPREDVFVTTKLWNGDHGRDRARRALEGSLERLGFEFVDLYLIHWPVPGQDQYVETWQTLIELKAEGRVRSIGVSNFLLGHLERIIGETGETPTVNQIELHPRLVQAELRGFHQEHAILTEAWSPLGRGELLDQTAIVGVARAHGRTPAQVMIRWHLQLGNVVIPKSVTPSRIEENFDVFDFVLDDEQMRSISELDAGHRYGPDPAQFG